MKGVRPAEEIKEISGKQALLLRFCLRLRNKKERRLSLSWKKKRNIANKMYLTSISVPLTSSFKNILRVLFFCASVNSISECGFCWIRTLISFSSKKAIYAQVGLLLKSTKITSMTSSSILQTTRFRNFLKVMESLKRVILWVSLSSKILLTRSRESGFLRVTLESTFSLRWSNSW